MRIDSHQHFWNYTQKEYPWMPECIQSDHLPEDLELILEAGELDGCISVQARQTVEETEWLLGLAEKHNIIKKVIGWVPLCEDQGGEALERLASHEKLAGVRHVIQDEEEDDFIMRPDFNAGVAKTGRQNLIYEILIYGRHLKHAINFADIHPEQSLVLDHIAKPTIKSGEFDVDWAKNIHELAQRPNVTCKLSGMANEVRDPTWNAAVLRPYFETAIDAFGPSRLMFGSDWPVCLVRTSYARWLGTVEGMISGLSRDEQAAIMGGNAARIYGI